MTTISRSGVFSAVAAIVASGACGGTTAQSVDPSSEPCGIGTIWCVDSCVAFEYAPSSCTGVPDGGYNGIDVDGGFAPDSSIDGGACSSRCGGHCTDTTSDATSCGACGHTCASGEVCASSACVADRVAPLAYDIVDAEYSRALDRIVIVSAAGNALHVYDPRTHGDSVVTLPATPTCVSVGPDGRFAAVGHDGHVSYVDLSAPSLVRAYDVSAPVGDVVLAGNGKIYAIPSSDQWVSIHTIDLTTGTDDGPAYGGVYAGTHGRLSLDGMSIYLADNLSPSTLSRVGIANGSPDNGTMSPDFGTYEACGNLWLSHDGTKIFTPCANVFHASNNTMLDMSYDGSLSGASMVAGVDDSVSAGRVAALAQPKSSMSMYPYVSVATEVQLYDTQFLSMKSHALLPPMHVGAMSAPSDGLFVFYDAAGTSLYAIVHARVPESGTDMFGIATVGP